VLVGITAYSDENAYTIFETMNDRGLNLTSTEMLKSYVLSKITDKNKRLEINDIGKNKYKNYMKLMKTLIKVSFRHGSEESSQLQ
jgi:uncharacterized protein with ParB-like and HNH nuclease domain